jgi:hypothetical protein
VIFLVFLELSFFIEKQFLNHPTLRRIGRDFEHGPEMLNVLPYEKRSAKGLRRRRRVGFEQINAPLCRLDDRFPMEKGSKVAADRHTRALSPRPTATAAR